MTQAWLITKEHIDNTKIVEAFVALLDTAVPSEVMLRITDDIYNASVRPQANPSSFDSERAAYRILNDGSPDTASIVCGHNPCLYTRRVYDIVITPDEKQAYLLHWREPHILIEDEMRKVEYWEDFSVLIPSVDRSGIND